MPHALLLEGPAGLGKRQFAWRIAGLALDIGSDPTVDEYNVPQHADLHFLTLEDDKKQIGVDAVRNLCRALEMTSHSGGYKVAVIDPADAMTRQAANSLLKTLEEPTPDTLLVLVRARLDTLPVTIASRCQRIRFPIPDADIAQKWLGDRIPDVNPARLLALAGGSPMRAIKLHGRGMDDLDRRFHRDILEIASGAADPVSVAEQWAKQDLADCLDWLNVFVCRVIARKTAGGVAGAADLQNLIDTLGLERLYWYLDDLQAARRRSRFALGSQSVLEGLLIPWTGKLEQVTPGAVM